MKGIVEDHVEPAWAAGEFPRAKALRLEALVDYAPGAAVSRVLLKSPVGTITLFSFDAGQGLSEHSAPFDALVQILDGRAELTVAGKTFAAATGDAVLFPANVPHAVQAVERFKMLLTMIRG
jgi:quercetin dioxygenase-like cupin family protein